MARTATCCTSSSRPSPTSAATSTAAALRTACASRSRSFDAVRADLPADSRSGCASRRPTGLPEGWDIEGTVALSTALKARGCAAIHVTTGGVRRTGHQTRPGLSGALRATGKGRGGLPSIAVGLITEPEQAEAIIANGEADAVSLARAMLYDPRWPWHAAAKLGGRLPRRSNTGVRSRGVQGPFRGHELRAAMMRPTPMQ